MIRYRFTHIFIHKWTEPCLFLRQMDLYKCTILGTLLLTSNCILQGIDVSPFKDSTVVADEDFFFQITENVMNIQSCSFHLNTEDIVLYNEGAIVSHDQFRYWKSNSGNCGVWVKAVTKGQIGSWELIARNSSDTYIGSVFVDVTDKIVPENNTNVIMLGGKAVINLGPPEVVYCKMFHPSGLSLGIKDEKCSHYLDSVRDIDAGQWTANYTVQGSLDELTATSTYTIEGVYEPRVSGQVSKSLTEENALNVMCQFSETVDKMNYCLFERPDGKGFLYNEGVGKDRYRSYKFGNRKDTTCGLTIINPTEEDFGIWKCEMSLSTSKYQDGTFIYIKKNDNESFPSLKLSTFQSEVVAVAGSKVVLGCYVRYALSSCWFRHPKGKIFNVDPKSDTKDFKYSGQSFGLGQCSIMLKNVTTDDVGEWSCNAALKNQSIMDYSVPIALYVEEQEIFAPLQEVKSYLTGSITLQCHSTDNDQPLSYCRFIHPSGRGFTLNDRYSVPGKYKYAGKGLDAGDCGIQISGIEQDDFGTWTCSASLLNNHLQEAQVLINLKKLDTSSAAVITATSVIAAGVVVAAVFVFYRLRKRRRHFSDVLSSNEMVDNISQTSTDS